MRHIPFFEPLRLGACATLQQLVEELVTRFLGDDELHAGSGLAFGDILRCPFELSGA